MCIGVLLNVYLFTMCMQFPQRQEKDSLVWFWATVWVMKINVGSMEYHLLLLITEASLQTKKKNSCPDYFRANRKSINYITQDQSRPEAATSTGAGTRKQCPRKQVWASDFHWKQEYDWVSDFHQSKPWVATSTETGLRQWPLPKQDWISYLHCCR